MIRRLPKAFGGLFRNSSRFTNAKSFYSYPVLDEEVNLDDGALKENFENMSK